MTKTKRLQLEKFDQADNFRLRSQVFKLWTQIMLTEMAGVSSQPPMTKDLREMLSSMRDRMNWSKYQLHFSWVNEGRIYKPPRQSLEKLSQVRSSGNHQWSLDKPMECFHLLRNSKLLPTIDEEILTMRCLGQEETIGSSLEATACQQVKI